MDGLPQHFVTRRELAELMGVSVGTVDNWLRQGIPHERWGLRAVRFWPADAIAWAQSRGTDREAA